METLGHPTIVAALIGASTALAGMAAGWVAATVDRRREARAEAARRRALRRSLRAEIHVQSRAASDVDFGAMADAVERRLQEEPDFTPFVPLRDRGWMMSQVREQLGLLGDEEAEAVLSYYGVVRAVESFERDLRSDAWAALETERKAQAFRHMLEMQATEARLAERAISALASEVA
ncbi:MAG: hypothetical protein AAF763_01580 [Pseudomonadota bacterium]